MLHRIITVDKNQRIIRFGEKGQPFSTYGPRQHFYYRLGKGRRAGRADLPVYPILFRNSSHQIMFHNAQINLLPAYTEDPSLNVKWSEDGNMASFAALTVDCLILDLESSKACILRDQQQPYLNAKDQLARQLQELKLEKLSSLIQTTYYPERTKAYQHIRENFPSEAETIIPFLEEQLYGSLYRRYEDLIALRSSFSGTQVRESFAPHFIPITADYRSPTFHLGHYWNP